VKLAAQLNCSKWKGLERDVIKMRKKQKNKQLSEQLTGQSTNDTWCNNFMWADSKSGTSQSGPSSFPLPLQQEFHNCLIIHKRYCPGLRR
jgi:hypothetical protein